jgi:uncharacterized membrane protein
MTEKHAAGPVNAGEHRPCAAGTQWFSAGVPDRTAASRHAAMTAGPIAFPAWLCHLLTGSARMKTLRIAAEGSEDDGAENMKRVVGGTMLMTVGLFMLLGFANADSDKSLAVRLIAFGIAVLLPLCTGAALVVSHYRRRHRLQTGRDKLARMSLESEVVKLARVKGGKLTAIEVVADLAVGKSTAVRLLESLAAQGLAEVELTESGVTVFAFYDVLHLKEKATAKGVLDA